MDKEDKRQVYLDNYPIPEEYQMAFAYGPAHIVVDDDNLADDHILFCMTRIGDYLKEPDKIADLPAFSGWSTGKNIEVLGKIYQLLENLLDIV